MNKDSPINAIIVVLLTALICSSLVSAAVVMLRPIQLNNQLLEQSRNIMQLTGLLVPGEVLDDEQTLSLYKSLSLVQDCQLLLVLSLHLQFVGKPPSGLSKKTIGNPFMKCISLLGVILEVTHSTIHFIKFVSAPRSHY